jgi:hypothetical protein
MLTRGIEEDRLLSKADAWFHVESNTHNTLSSLPPAGFPTIFAVFE